VALEHRGTGASWHWSIVALEHRGTREPRCLQLYLEVYLEDAVREAVPSQWPELSIERTFLFRLCL